MEGVFIAGDFNEHVHVFSGVELGRTTASAFGNGQIHNDTRRTDVLSRKRSGKPDAVPGMLPSFHAGGVLLYERPMRNSVLYPGRDVDSRGDWP